MLNYLKSEIYRNLRSKGNYILVGGCSAFVIFLVVVLHLFSIGDPSFPYSNTEFAFSSFCSSLIVPFTLCTTLVAIVNGNEFKNRTLKNTVAFGISRNDIYLGKALIELLIAFITLVVVVSCYIISSYLLLKDSGIQSFNSLISSVIWSAPLFVVSVMLSHALYFSYDNETKIVSIWIIIMFVFPIICNMLSGRVELFNIISEYMPINMIGVQSENESGLVMYWSEISGMIKCTLVGIIGSLLFYIGGLRNFEKREIK